MEQSRSRNAVAPTPRPIGADAFGAVDGTHLWWLGGAGFLLNSRGTLIAVDPAVSMAPGSADVSEFGLRMLAPHPQRRRCSGIAATPATRVSSC